MTINDKIQKFFAAVNIKMTSKPAEHLTHLFADYLEIISLFSNKNYVSSSDLIDRFKDEGLILKKKSDSDQAEDNDKHEKWVSQIFEIICERKILFQDDYAFEVLGNNKIRLKDMSALNNRHKLYLFLLISSSLSLFDIFESDLTSEFELVCYNVLRNFLPKHSVVKSLGKKSDYSGTAIDKMKKLADDLKITINDTSTSKISLKELKKEGLTLLGGYPLMIIYLILYLFLVNVRAAKNGIKS